MDGINTDPEAPKVRGTNQLKFFIFMSLGIIVLVGLIAVAVFFFALRGEEQTLVPDVRGKDLVAALLELQAKELYPRIQLRYSQSAHDRGLILEQEPAAGGIVKAGRRIRLVVSQGVMLNTVDNYRGRNIDDVRMELQTLFASAAQPLLSLKEPFMYEYSRETAGTILQQRPEPGTDISAPMVLEFVVSRGEEKAVIKTPNLVGLSLNKALDEISRSGLDFVFTLRTAEGNEKPETVVSQNPSGQSAVTANTRLSLTVASPLSEKEGEVFGLFRYTIPRNPYPLPVLLEAQLPSGERRRIIAVDYSGGEFTVPYRLPTGAVLVLSMLDREIYRQSVTPPVSDLSLDQL